MRIRVVLNEPFEQIDNGWSLRYVNLLSELARQAQVTIFLPGSDRKLAERIPHARIRSTNDTAAAPTPPKSLLGFARALVVPRPSNVQLHGFRFYPSLLTLLEQDRDSYDAEFYLHMSAIVLYGAASRAPVRICDFCDSRLRALRSQLPLAASWSERLSLHLQMLYVRRVKQRLVPRDVHVLAITERDCREIRAALPGQSVTCVPNGVRSLAAEDLERDLRQRFDSKQIVFFGTLHFPPNIDAATRLLQRIWPVIHARRPDLRLLIVGRNPSDELVAQAAATPNVRLERDVPQIEPYLRASRFSICPMFLGAGMKNKILESLAVGLPVIGTPEAIEGIEFQHGRHGWLAESEDALATSLLEALEVPYSRYEQMCRAALSLAEVHSWQRAATSIIEVIPR
ncbi:MAG: glycosyltransferase [Gammaproteobacteria bacterium]|nr:hypothetical protein [Gammaproteobacteria bacterium]